jgi:hypothetical protein
MTDEQKRIADKIVAYLKSVKGVNTHINAFRQILESDTAKSDVGYVLRILEEKNIVKTTNIHERQIYYLLPDGWNYTSYDDLLEKERTASETKSRKDKVDLANAERVYKSYPLTRAAAWVGAISGAIALLLKLAELFGILPKSK